MGLQTGLAQPALVHAAKWHPMRTTDHPTHGSLPFPLPCPIEIDGDLEQALLATCYSRSCTASAAAARMIVCLKACSAGEAVTAEKRRVEQTIYSPTEFRSPRFAVPSLSFQRTAGPQPSATATTQEIPLTALCCFRESERTEIAVPPLSASRSCHSYLIAAGVPGGSGRGSTSTTP